MKIIGVIPARYASTRFPGKPLIDIGGKSMIQRVFEQCLKADVLADVIVATDDERILNHVIGFGGKAMLTAATHQSGTDRCAEVLSKLQESYDAVINIQGDEPFIDPQQIKLLASAFEHSLVEIASLKKAIKSEEEIRNPNVVKVVTNANGEAIYFSRSPIPYRRNPEANITYYKHVGIYGYKAQVLTKLTQLPMGVLEQAESLEQLRWLENGFKMMLKETDMETVAVDTPDDLANVEKILKSQK
ncbi:MAG: 3-deoxy-manno-octulosonate cytidylyltransferase [Bacteroidota bacterium]|jgi:3-deoxy-manno-octulosonate cytidylyltransferase (CMP-KDO synthetase)